MDETSKWKKSVWEESILYDSNYMLFWERHNCGYNRRILWVGAGVGTEDKGILGQYDIIMADIHCTFAQTHRRFDTKREF